MEILDDEIAVFYIKRDACVRAISRRGDWKSEVVVDFTFFPPMGRGREPIVASVIFTDNYGDEHLLQSVRFRCEQ